MAIIDSCENYRNFSHVPIRDFSVAENLIKHCGLYNNNIQTKHQRSIGYTLGEKEDLRCQTTYLDAKNES